MDWNNNTAKVKEGVTPSGNGESVKELMHKMNTYDKAIEESEMQRVIALYKAGPYVSNGISRARVDVGGGEIIVSIKPTIKEKIEIGDEVILMKGMIIDVVPKVLKKVKTNKGYKLANWEDVVGLDDQLSEIKSAIKAVGIDEELYKEFGVEPVKGIVLYGPPGCGKTLIGKCIAADILKNKTAEEGQFTFVKGAEILNKYVGESEATVTRLFKNARDYTRKTGNKAVIFIDEADAILGTRGQNNISSTVVPTFLSEMDGLEGDNPFVLLSTNLVDNLDSAIVRDGRMDIKIEIKRPNQKAIKSLLIHYLNKVKCFENVDELSEKYSNQIMKSPFKKKRSGAMISNLINLSAKSALERFVNNNDESKGIISEDIDKCLIKITN